MVPPDSQILKYVQLCWLGFCPTFHLPSRPDAQRGAGRASLEVQEPEERALLLAEVATSKNKDRDLANRIATAVMDTLDAALRRTGPRTANALVALARVDDARRAEVPATSHRRLRLRGRRGG